MAVDRVRDEAAVWCVPVHGDSVIEMRTCTYTMACDSVGVDTNSEMCSLDAVCRFEILAIICCIEEDPRAEISACAFLQPEQNLRVCLRWLFWDGGRREAEVLSTCARMHGCTCSDWCACSDDHACMCVTNP